MKFMSLDMQMIQRYSQCLDSHPHTMLCFASEVPNMKRVISGELVHCMVTKGTLLQVRWIPAKDVQWIFDAYSQ